MRQGRNLLKLYVCLFIRLCKRNPIWLTILIGGLLGLVAFLCVYGIGLVNPLNTEWLKLAKNDPFVLGLDLKQHFLGWEWYRNAPWTWPIGLISTQAYPTGISVTYLDSISLLVIPFKLISWLLPANFQYIGMWQLACFVLQGIFAALIVRIVTRHVVVIASGTLLFVFSSLLMTRIFFHDALAS